MRRMQTLGLGAILCTVFGGPAMAQANVAAAPQSAAQSTPQSPPPAQTLIDDAVKKAKAEHKAVFVHLGASWCGYCRMLDKFLDSTDAGRVMASYYEIVSLTARENGDKRALENPGADSIMGAMGVDGLPGFFFLDEEGKQTVSSMVMPPNGGNMGYPATPEEVKMFGELLQKTAPRMVDADRAKIIDYLTSVGKSLSAH